MIAYQTNRESGFSLLEVTIATALLTVLVSAAMLMSQTSASALRQSTIGHKSQYQLKRAIRCLADDIACAGVSRTQIIPGIQSDQLELQVVDRNNVGNNPAWGYYDSNDVFQDDWYALYSVVNGVLVVSSMDSNDTQVGDSRVLCCNLETTLKSFEVSRLNKMVTVTVRVREELDGAEPIVRQQGTTLLQRME